MTLTRKLNLQQKGWSDAEIKRAEAALAKTERYDLHFSKIVFWSALLVIIFANVIVSLILVPFLIVLNNAFLYFIVVVLGGVIGFLYNFLITNIGHLERKHHLLAGIIIPLIGLINMVAVVILSNNFITNLQINNPVHNPWLIALVFAIALMLPAAVNTVLGAVSKKR